MCVKVAPSYLILKSFLSFFIALYIGPTIYYIYRHIKKHVINACRCTAESKLTTAKIRAAAAHFILSMKSMSLYKELKYHELQFFIVA